MIRKAVQGTSTVQGELKRVPKMPNMPKVKKKRCRVQGAGFTGLKECDK
jgi:hypothetical protein